MGVTSPAARTTLPARHCLQDGPLRFSTSELQLDETT